MFSALRNRKIYTSALALIVLTSPLTKKSFAKVRCDVPGRSNIKK